MVRASTFLLLAATLARVTACSSTPGGAPREVAALLAVRFTTGRLVEFTEWRACPYEARIALIPRARCGDSDSARSSVPPERFATKAARLGARFAADSSTGGRYARALIDLRGYRAVPTALDHAVTQLERVVHERPLDAAPLNDLAVAYLEVATRDETMLPLLRGLDALERALAIDSTLMAARFNQALVLERLFLAASARREWARYVAAERDPGWRRDGAEHLAAAERVLTADRASVALALPPRVSDADPALLLALRSSRRHSRELAILVLGSWGRSLRAGDSTRAAAALALARACLARDTARTDETTPRALAAIDAAAASPATARRIAAAYVALADGHREYAARRYERALAPLSAARSELRAVGSPFAGWSALYLAGADLSLGRYAEAYRLLNILIVDSAAAEPSLAARARLVLGVSQVRRGQFEQAIESYRAAAPYLERERDREARGYGAYLLAEGLALAGQSRAGQDAALRALWLLVPFRQSNYLNNQLEKVADQARAEGLPHAALAVIGEVVNVASQIGMPDVLALALCDRARDLTAVGRRDDAEAALRAAEVWADSIPRGGGHARVRAAVLLARGELTRVRDPRRALPLLAAAVDTFRAFSSDMYLPTALYQAAEAAEASGDRVAAGRWLREAVGTTELQEAAFRRAGNRAAFAETVERVWDRLILTELASGRPDSAFVYLERARLAAWPGEARPRVAPSALAALGNELPSDMVLADYALLHDRLVIWSLSRGATRLHVVPVTRDSVAALVARLRDELLADGRSRGARPVSSQLHALLLRPLHEELSGARRLVVVPDRELNEVPFAALWGDATQRFAVEDVEIRAAPSAAFLQRVLAGRRGRLSGGTTLVVGDPVLSAEDSTLLERLPGAAAEASQVARLHPSAVLLQGRAARRSAVVSMLPRAAILHFAGHAVFNSEQPELSYLALASDARRNGRLHAWEIGALRLSHTRVVVLSACETMNARPSRAGGVAGLAYSFLEAGAPSIVSTLWPVNDGATVELVVDLHRALAEGVDASGALRAAQLRALRAADPVLRSPHVWAAFTYTGP